MSRLWSWCGRTSSPRKAGSTCVRSRRRSTSPAGSRARSSWSYRGRTTFPGSGTKRRAGDGVFATFDGPGRAIQCAREIGREARQLGLEIRAGIHTGECELGADRVSGIVVHIGARIAALAAPGEVLVSSTVKDLVAGSELEFQERGLTTLKGIPGEWRLHVLLTDAPPSPQEARRGVPMRADRVDLREARLPPEL